jgi:transglutaminase-like putative cysteine protease
MIYQIRNLTEIAYTPPVTLARFNLRLRPADWPNQRLLNYALEIEPQPAAIREEQGPYLVNTSRLVLDGTIKALRIDSNLRVEVLPPAIDPESVASPSIAEIRAAALARCDLNATSPCSYLFASPIAVPADEISDWARKFLADGQTVVAGGKALMAAIYTEFRYESGATNSYTPPLEAFRERHGVCQDFAHVMIIAARAHGIPAAYVSGYLRTIPPKGKARLVGADATHAWVNLWCGAELGWIGFDPTNNLIVRSDHIFTAMGRDYTDVAPLDGVFRGGGKQKMKVSVDVAPVDEVLPATA